MTTNQNQIAFKRVSESEVSRTESIAIQSFVEKNSEKALQVVSGLIEKTFASKVKKLDVGAEITFYLDSVLNELAISAAGRITRETFLEYFKSRKEEIAILYGLSKGISADKFQSFNNSQLEKLFALVDALIERVSISAAGRTLAASASASVAELEIFLALPDLPETFVAKIQDSIAEQNLDFI